jgi:hypothetical protein
MLQLRAEKNIHTIKSTFRDMVIIGQKKRAKSKPIKEKVLGLNIPLRSSLRHLAHETNV